jgi:hypothetical protein
LCQPFTNIQIFVVQIQSRTSQMMVSEIPRYQPAWIFPGTLQPGKGQRAVHVIAKISIHFGSSRALP